MTGQWDVRGALLFAANESNVALAPEVDPLAVTLYSGNLLSLLTEMNGVNGTRHFIKPADDSSDWYKYTTRNRQYKLGASPDADIDLADDGIAIDGWRVSADTVINQQAATIDWPDFPPSPILVWTYEGVPPLPLTIGTTPLVLTIAYADYVPSCPIVTWTSTGDDLTIGFINQGFGGVLTLTSAGTSVVSALSIYGDEAVREPEQTYTADNTTSQAFPRGVRAGADISGDMVGVMASARGIAQHMVWRYSGLDDGGHLVPMKRPSLTLVNWLPDAFTLDLYDVISITSAQLRATGVVFEIVGFSEQVNHAPDSGDVYIVTTYQLQESRLQSPKTWFTLDVSALDAGSDPGTIFGLEGTAGDTTADLSWSVSSGASADPLAY